MCPTMRPVDLMKKGKTGQKLSCVKLAICPDHPRRHRPLKFCMRGRVRKVVIYFTFHENRFRGLGAVGVENRPLPLTRRMAYTTACTTVQAVILSCRHGLSYVSLFTHPFSLISLRQIRQHMWVKQVELLTNVPHLL